MEQRRSVTTPRRKKGTGTARRPGYEAPTVKILTSGQVQKLCKELYRYRFGALVMLLATTGMRFSESLGLRWSDVDFKARKITIQRSIVPIGKTLHEVGLKTDASKRRVTIAKDILAALREHRERMKEEGKDIAAGPVFLTRDGRTPSSRYVSEKVLRPALLRAKLPRIRLHDLRHSFVAML